MRINIQKLFYLPIILLFLPAFVMWLPGLNTIFHFFYLAIYVVIIILFLKYPKVYVNKIKSFINKTPLKIFLLALILMIVNSVLLSIIGTTTIGIVIKNVFFQIILRIIPLFLYFIFIIDKYISYKHFVKLFLILFWMYMCLGVLIFLAQVCNIQIILNITDFLSNARLIRGTNTGSINFFSEVSNYYAFGLPRLDNLHEEPSHYARFIYIFLPLIYSFNLAQIKLVKNNYLNYFIKKTFIPITIINSILTMSPIFLIFIIMITIIYFFKEIILFAQKYLFLLLSICTTFIIFICNINFTNTYLSRIVNLITQVRTFNDFILVEESLAIRIVNYINAICLFLKYPFSGVGIGNLKYCLLKQYEHSPLPLTPRIESRIELANFYNTPVMFDPSLITMLLSESGIIITLIFVYFLFVLFKSISKLLKLSSSNKNNFYFVNLKGIKYCLIGMFIIMFYDSSLLTTEFYMIFIMSIILIYKYKTRINYGKNINF